MVSTQLRVKGLQAVKFYLVSLNGENPNVSEYSWKLKRGIIIKYLHIVLNTIYIFYRIQFNHKNNKINE